MKKDLKDRVLFLDLDNTIFPTKSMDKKLFEPFIADLTRQLKPFYEQSEIQNVIADLWNTSFDSVVKKYKISKELINGSLQILNNLDIELKIQTYSDYSFLQKLSNPKFLITTGITHVQKAKIKALSIGHDFVEIIINDTTRENKTKKDMFRDLVKKYDLLPENIYVIGDDPDSEIKAGNELNMITVQIFREQVKKAGTARYYIKSFDELEAIMS